MADIKSTLEKMLLQALLALIGKFGEAVRTFIVELQKQMADNPTLDETAQLMIRRVQEEHPGWSWLKKLEYVSQAGLDHFAEVAKDVGRAAVSRDVWNSVIDLNVVHMRRTGELPDNATRSLGSTQGGTSA